MPHRKPMLVDFSAGQKEAFDIAVEGIDDPHPSHAPAVAEVLACKRLTAGAEGGAKHDAIPPRILGHVLDFPGQFYRLLIQRCGAAWSERQYEITHRVLWHDSPLHSEDAV